MKQTIDKCQFISAFQNIRPDNFSYEGLVELFNYLTQLEDDTGVEMELDVIAICCDFTESSYQQVKSDYNLDDDTNVLQYLEDNTLVLEVDDDTVIYQNF